MIKIISRYFPFQKIAWTLVFMLALGFCLCDGSLLWLARIGWILLAILFSLHRRYAIYSFFFFAAFFCPAGFLQHAPMSLKHFHIACILLFTVDLLRGGLSKRLRKGAAFLRALLPFAIVLALGSLISLRQGFLMQSFRTPLNVGLVLVLLYYLYCCIASFEPLERATVLRRSVLALCAGSAVQCGMAIFNNFAETNHWGIILFHNNHLGNLSLFALFYVLALYVTAQKFFEKSVYLVLFLIIFGAVVASCSRTAWLSGFFGFCVFFWLARRFLQQDPRRALFRSHVLPIALPLGLLFIFLLFKSETIVSRIIGLQEFLDPIYLRFALWDQQNLGFLGIFRLKQYLFLKDILATQGLLGIGFIKEVVDFHGLHLVLLGAAGIAGFSIFLMFCVRHLAALRRALRTAVSVEMLFMLIAAFSTFAAWLILSFMETFLVHFIVWINVMLGVLLVELSKDLNEKRPQTTDNRLQHKANDGPPCQKL